MSDNKNVDVVLKWVEASNEHNVDKIVALLHPDFEYEFSNSSLIGKENIYEGWKEFLEAFPDLHYKIEQIIDGGEYIVTRIRMTATQKGPLKFVGIHSEDKAIPASNKPIDLETCSIHRVKDGKITHLWRYWDSATMLKQMGYSVSIKD